MQILRVPGLAGLSTGKEQEKLERIADSINKDKKLRNDLLRAVRKGEAGDIGDIKISIGVYREANLIEKVFLGVVRFALSEIHPVVNALMMIDLNGAIRLIPDKKVAKSINVIINAIKGDVNKVVIKVSELDPGFGKK
jgi:hypothetical protein